jgi:hypothetical protein
MFKNCSLCVGMLFRQLKWINEQGDGRTPRMKITEGCMDRLTPFATIIALAMGKAGGSGIKLFRNKEHRLGKDLQSP